jgi:hypothetical protein
MLDTSTGQTWLLVQGPNQALMWEKKNDRWAACTVALDFKLPHYRRSEAAYWDVSYRYLINNRDLVRWYTERISRLTRTWQHSQNTFQEPE